jgi:hypothetical protein
MLIEFRAVFRFVMALAVSGRAKLMKFVTAKNLLSGRNFPDEVEKLLTRWRR